jgi:hypothetical protein
MSTTTRRHLRRRGVSGSAMRRATLKASSNKELKQTRSALDTMAQPSLLNSVLGGR